MFITSNRKYPSVFPNKHKLMYNCLISTNYGSDIKELVAIYINEVVTNKKYSRRLKPSTIDMVYKLARYVFAREPNEYGSCIPLMLERGYTKEQLLEAFNDIEFVYQTKFLQCMFAEHTLRRIHPFIKRIVGPCLDIDKWKHILNR